MPYIVVMSWYPPHLANKVAQKYLEAMQKMPLPSNIKRLVPAASTATKDGIWVINVDEVKREDLGEAMQYGVQFMLEFREFEGFTYDIRTFSTVAEALSNIGLS